MPIQATQLTDGVYTIPVEVTVPDAEGKAVKETLNVKSRTLTFKLMDALDEATRAAEGADPESAEAQAAAKPALVRSLAALLVDMDVVDERKRPVKPTVEFLESVDMYVLIDVSKGVSGYFFRRGQSGVTSDDSTQQPGQ